MIGQRWRAVLVVVIMLAVLGVTFNDVSKEMRQEAEHYCNARGGELSIENRGDWNDERMVCTYPNGTQESVYVDNLTEVAA